MRVCIALLVLVAAAAAIQAVPTFPQDFTVIEEDDIDIHQGQYTINNVGTCCPKDAIGCKVQVQNEGGRNYHSATKKMTAFAVLGTDQVLVSDYTTNKQYSVVNGTCQAYCPLQDDEFPSFGINANATTVPDKVINGVTCKGYTWKTTLLGIITMETSTFYVDESDPSKPVPCAEYDILTPFGKAIGSESATWLQWAPGTVDPKIFEFANKDSCEESNQCNSNAQLARYLRQKQYKTYLYHARGISL